MTINYKSAPDIAARTAWGEARGEGAPGMQAVLNVVANRAAQPCWWGRSILSVCLKAEQFSCWNENDPNREKLLAVTGADPEFVTASSLAESLVAGTLADITGGADHYYSAFIAAPGWTIGRKPTAHIGHQLFYRLGPYGRALEASA